MRLVLAAAVLIMASLAPARAADEADDPAAGADHAVRITLDFEGGRLGRASVSGLADPVTARPATIEDPVRIASISKLAVAIAVLRLVDKGVLDLDRDVSRDLGWPVRHPRFPAEPVTLRRLLSHQSGLTDNAGYVLPLDARLADLLARPEAWDAGHPPGAYFRYANVNFPVVAAVMEAATGMRFDRIMAEELFDPLGIPACFNWTGCAADARGRAIALYRPDGSVARDGSGADDGCAFPAASDGRCTLDLYRPGQNGSAFSPQGGLRISAAGLARIGQLLLTGGDGLLSPAAFAELTRAQWRFDGQNGDDDHGYFTAYGLGLQRIEADDATWIGHPGEAYGLRAGLWVDRAAGTGIVRIATGIAEDYPPGHCLIACP